MTLVRKKITSVIEPARIECENAKFLLCEFTCCKTYSSGKVVLSPTFLSSILCQAVKRKTINASVLIHQFYNRAFSRMYSPQALFPLTAIGTEFDVHYFVPHNLRNNSSPPLLSASPTRHEYK